ncbi:MAG: glycosyltransferase family 2 protein, partial [Alphaproteobacteria bacterium]
MATYNGARTLPLTLDSFCALQPPPGGFEVIVVDNGSRDATPAILQHYRARLPLKILHEPRPGKSCAVNRGFREAAGDLILLTDDDVIAAPDWLLAYARAAAAMPTVALFAGQVRHHWCKTPPAWLECLARDGNAFAGTPVNRPAGPIEATAVKGPN